MMRWITVTTVRPNEVPAYLYAHTTVVARGEGGGVAFFILATTAESLAQAEYLSGYQADRLASGMHGARTWTSYAQAERALRSYGCTVLKRVQA